MAANTDREERFLMRQRGAGKHKVQDTDFGFAIPPPSSSAKSSQAPSMQSTPQQNLNQIQRSGGSTAKPIRRGPQDSIPEKAVYISDSESIQRYESDSGTRSASLELEIGTEDTGQKRRRLTDGVRRTLSFSKGSPITNGRYVTPVVSTPGSTAPNSRRSNLSKQLEAEVASSSGKQLSSVEDVDGQSASKNNTAKASRGRPRKIRSEDNSKNASPVGVLESLPGSASTRKRGRPRVLKNVQDQPDNLFAPVTDSVKGPNARKRAPRTDVVAVPEDHSQDELYEALEAQRRKEKRRARPPATRRSTEPTSPTSDGKKLPISHLEGGDDEENESGRESQVDDEDEYEDPTYEANESTVVLDNTVLAPEAEEDDVEEFEDRPVDPPQGQTNRKSPALSLEERERSISVQPQVSKSKPPPKKSKPRTVTSETGAPSQQATNTVPIVVHRLPTTANNMDDDDSEDDLVKDNFIRRGGVNAIDVLGQICRELVAKTVELLWQEQHHEKNNVKKGEWRRKRKAVEAFGTELDTRCFELTEALDNNHALTTRLKATHKKKLELREQLLHVRKDRERLAIRTDEVRRRYEAALKAFQGDSDLNDAMQDLELAVERGQALSENDDDLETSGIEYLLKSVAADVSSTAPEGGLLRRVREFNDFLEKAAEVLESRY
ncbi:MAG: hypothetical protein M1814_002436 [Vezdaea aestivalis]|nr:MAG: hypothetical protein M1814_002436 [Vezdaea aestivalis]